jgi:hypothetical protein
LKCLTTIQILAKSTEEKTHCLENQVQETYSKNYHFQAYILQLNNLHIPERQNHNFKTKHISKNNCCTVHYVHAASVLNFNMLYSACPSMLADFGRIVLLYKHPSKPNKKKSTF